MTSNVFYAFIISTWRMLKHKHNKCKWCFRPLTFPQSYHVHFPLRFIDNIWFMLYSTNLFPQLIRLYFCRVFLCLSRVFYISIPYPLSCTNRNTCTPRPYPWDSEQTHFWHISDLALLKAYPVLPGYRNHILIQTKMAKLYTLFKTKMTQNPFSLAPHMPPSPGP